MALPAVSPSEPTPERVNVPTPSGVPLGGGTALLLGLPFIGTGLFVLAVSAGLLPSMRDSMNAPAPVVGAVGVVFAWAGFMVSWQGVKSFYRELRYGRLRVARFEEPWLWDHSWHSSKAKSHKVGKALKGFAGFLFFAMFLAPFNWIGFVHGDKIFAIVTSIFDLIALAVLWGCIHGVLQRMKYGNLAIAYDELPIRLGSKASLRVEGLKRGSPGDEVTLTLRFVEERFETTGTGDDRKREIICYALYSDTRTMSRESLQSGIEWPLPDNRELATVLSERPARFWDLELRISVEAGDARLRVARGPDYEEHFLLPIY